MQCVNCKRTFSFVAFNADGTVCNMCREEGVEDILISEYETETTDRVPTED